MIDFHYPRVLPVGENASKRRSLRLYMYVTADALFAIIRSGRLRLSHPWKTNDITECLAQHEMKLRRAVKEYGYLCFTSDPTSPAMWGYYADRGKGACLAFEFDTVEVQEGVYELICNGGLDVEHPIYLRRVRYEAERYTGPDTAETFFVKSCEWAHEQEYRILFPLQHPAVEAEEACSGTGWKIHHYFRGLMNYLCGIVLGPKFADDEMEVVSYLKHCTPAEIKKTVQTSGPRPFQYAEEVGGFARFAPVVRAELNPVSFRFDVADVFDLRSPTFFQDRKMITPLSLVEPTEYTRHSELTAAAQRFFPAVKSLVFCTVRLNLHPQGIESFYLARIDGKYLLLRQSGSLLTAEPDYPEEALENLYARFLQKFPEIPLDS